MYTCGIESMVCTIIAHGTCYVARRSGTTSACINVCGKCCCRISIMCNAININ